MLQEEPRAHLTTATRPRTGGFWRGSTEEPLLKVEFRMCCLCDGIGHVVQQTTTQRLQNPLIKEYTSNHNRIHSMI